MATLSTDETIGRGTVVLSSREDVIVISGS